MSEQRRLALKLAALVVPNTSWSNITFADAQLMTIQIIEEYERGLAMDAQSLRAELEERLGHA